MQFNRKEEKNPKIVSKMSPLHVEHPGKEFSKQGIHEETKFGNNSELEQKLYDAMIKKIAARSIRNPNSNHEPEMSPLHLDHPVVVDFGKEFSKQGHEEIKIDNNSELIEPKLNATRLIRNPNSNHEPEVVLYDKVIKCQRCQWSYIAPFSNFCITCFDECIRTSVSEYGTIFICTLCEIEPEEYCDRSEINSHIENVHFAYA